MLENGEWFEGGFHEDKINGKGKFVNLEGEVIYGRWKDNIMVEEYADWQISIVDFNFSWFSFFDWD